MLGLASFSYKVGATFYATCTYRDPLRVPVDLNAAQIAVSSSLVSPNGDRIDLSVTLLDQVQSPGGFTVRTPTDGFVVGTWVWDIRYVDVNGFVTFTDTISISFQSPVTQ